MSELDIKEFKKLKEWAIKCPIEAAMRIQELEKENNSLKEELEEKIVFINNGWEEERYVLQEKAREQQKKIKSMYNAIEYINNAIYTQHCTMNHIENTEFERGKINGLIAAGNIVEKAFRIIR